jgi:D-2-hydroxyglutarate dehydrogenase
VQMRARLGAIFGEERARVVGYGHLGDGNLHLNVSCPGGYDERVASAIEPFIYEYVGSQRGSVSAEHGLGRMKAEEIGFSKSEGAVQLMGVVKKAFDPNGTMNPCKVRACD